MIENVCSVYTPGVFTFLEQMFDCQNGISVVSTPKSPFRVRYPLRQNIEKSSISPLFTSPKITTITPKILSNPYKLRLLSNSTENTIYNKEITLQNQLIYNSPTTQNTSKINTFQQYQVYKQHHFIEVINFIIKFILNLHQEFTQNNISLHYHLITNIITNIPYLQSLD